MFNEAFSQANSVIVFTKSWSAVHNTCTHILCDKITFDYSEAFVLSLVLKVVEQGDVLLANQVFALDLFKNLELLDVRLLQGILQS